MEAGTTVDVMKFLRVHFESKRFILACARNPFIARPTTTREIVMLQIGTRAPWGFRTCHGMTGMKGGRGLRDRHFCAGLLYSLLDQYST
jgi:hypothetical protein